MGRTRRRHTRGWIVIDKRDTPQRWVAHWYFNESYLDAKGVLRYRQGAHVLGFKTKDDLPTKGAAQKRWEAQHNAVIHGARTPGSEAKPDPAFQRFLNEEFIPVRRSAWNKATREKLSYYFNLMCADFVDTQLPDLDKSVCSGFWTACPSGSVTILWPARRRGIPAFKWGQAVTGKRGAWPPAGDPGCRSARCTLKAGVSI